MFLKSLGEHVVVELDSADCETLARACRLMVGAVDAEMNTHEAMACFFAAASAICRMHGWANQPEEGQAKLDALVARMEGRSDGD